MDLYEKKGMKANMNMSPILVIGAMEVEVDFLISKIENKKETTIANYHFYEGIIDSYPVVVAKSEIGIIHSTAVTTLAIENYHPICIINQGTAGGFGKEVHTKDIIIGAECFSIMSAKTPYREENKGSDSTKWDYITFVSDDKDEKICQKADERLVKFFKELEEDYTEGKIYVGTIGSGDVWNREKDRILYFNQVHKILCEEMEGISVYTLAKQYQIPVVGIRIISNNELLGEPYDRNLGKVCQKFVYKGIKKMIKNIKLNEQIKQIKEQ